MNGSRHSLFRKYGPHKYAEAVVRRYLRVTKYNCFRIEGADAVVSLLERLRNAKCRFNLTATFNLEYLFNSEKVRDVCKEFVEPPPKIPTDLYRHFSSDGELLYVGISLSAVYRLSQHRQSSWYHQIARIEIEKCASREEALEREYLAIQTERPKFNRAHAVAA